MHRVSSRTLSRILLSPALRRALALLLALAQLGVSLAPAFHSRDAGDRVAHFEDGGTRLHYTHDETACPSCTATVGGPIARAATLVEPPLRGRAPSPRFTIAPASESVALSHPPRAPPASIV